MCCRILTQYTCVFRIVVWAALATGQRDKGTHREAGKQVTGQLISWGSTKDSCSELEHSFLRAYKKYWSNFFSALTSVPDLTLDTSHLQTLPTRTPSSCHPSAHCYTCCSCFRWPPSSSLQNQRLRHGRSVYWVDDSGHSVVWAEWEWAAAMAIPDMVVTVWAVDMGIPCIR